MPAQGRDETISKSEVRADPPNLTHSHLRDVVWDMFEVQDYRREATPTRPLDSLHLRTRTHATRIPNLCRFDLVWVEFEELDPRDSGAGAASKATGLSSSSYWTYLGPPPGVEDEDWWQDDPVSVEACAALPDDHPAFAAPDDLEALEGYWAWAALRDAVAREEDFPLECIVSPRDDHPCRPMILATTIDALTDVRRCTSHDGGACYRLTFGDKRVTVDFDTPISGSDVRVARVSFNQMIVTGLTPID